MVALFTIAIFVAAFLLFLIQPLAARLVLPHLGGSPAVWTGTMMLFQFLLLAGYGYAHWLGRLGSRAQGIIHAGLLASCVLFLPLTLPGWWEAGSMPPLASLLVALAGSVGLPFLAISSASPLIQSWFARTGHARARDPYFLYAASNAGSLLGLLCYPVLVEPALGLREQGWAWSAGYALCVVLLGACWWGACRPARVASQGPAPTRAAEGPTTALLTGSSLWKRRALWVALAAAPSSLSLGVTQFLTTDVAAVPLLWVLPLSIYLVTYIAAFSRAGARGERLGRAALPLCVVAVTAAILMRASGPLLVVGGLHLLLLAAAGLSCHGRLAALRPEASRLTEFYFLASLGGALGGVFNALVAPLVFDTILEYPIAIAACAALLALRASPMPEMRGKGDQGAPAEPADEANASAPRRFGLLRTALWPVLAVLGIGAVVVAMEALVAIWSLDDDRMLAGVIDARTAGRLLTVGVPSILAFIASSRPLIFAAVVGTLTGQAASVPIGSSRFDYEILAIERSFFGVCMVTQRERLEYADAPPQPPLRSLQHGTTLHGQQFVDPEREFEPLSYYTRRGPVGDTFSRLPDAPRSVALIGLGAGSIASYARPADTFDFFEIDPLVARLARDPKYFTFLSGCQGDWRIILGDGRLKIAEQPPATYDLVILDAFSSDSIPVHLLTLEAITLYQSRLKPGGTLLIHISNRHFRLLEPVGRAARDLSLHAIHRADAPTIDEIWATGAMPSNWVLLSADLPFLRTFNGAGWEPVETPAAGKAWTDDHANVLECMYFN